MRSDFNNISSALDATDLQLLANLQADASISNIALADKLRISAATCLRRTKRLLQEGWIEKQVAILSSDKLGQLMGHSVKYFLLFDCFISFILKTEKSKKGCPTNEFFTTPSKYFFSKGKSKSK